MTKPGRKPVPTAILKTRGSWRAKNRKNEVQPPPGSAVMPRWLNTDAKAVWKIVIPQLGEMGVLAKIDTNAIARYCDAFARWKKMAKILDSGETMDFCDAEGGVKYSQQKPQVAIYYKLNEMLNKFEASFGLTPSARVGLTSGQKKPKSDGKERFFGAG